MGTPEFAVHILDAVIREGHEVVGVVTAPDRPAGRGRRVNMPAVKQYALSRHLEVLQPDNLNCPEFADRLAALCADVFVVVAFRILPETVYTIPPEGTFNIHASLLPQYRGAAPIQRAIMNGETKTGVTAFFLDRHTDTGDIIGQREVPIADDDDGGSLHDKLMAAGARLALQTLRDMAEGKVKAVRQTSPARLKTAPKIFRDDMIVNWDDTAENIHNKIRALSPVPAACTHLPSRMSGAGGTETLLNVKLYKSSLTRRKSETKPGTITFGNGEKMYVSTRNTDISIENLQIEGRKKMEVADFLKGFRPENYTLRFV